MADTQTFTWAPAPELQMDGTFTVLKSQFDDGYAQRVPDGINNEALTGPLSFTGNSTKIAAILAFLRAHKGATAFYWTPPLGTQGLYTCEKYSTVTHTRDSHTLTATFEQTFAP